MKDWRGLTNPRSKCMTRVRTGTNKVHMYRLIRVKKKRQCITRHRNHNQTLWHSSQTSKSIFGHPRLILIRIVITKITCKSIKAWIKINQTRILLVVSTVIILLKTNIKKVFQKDRWVVQMFKEMIKMKLIKIIK